LGTGSCEDPEHLGDQRGSAADGDVDGLAKHLVETDGGVDGRAVAFGRLARQAEQAQLAEGLAQFGLVEGLFQEGQGAQFTHAAHSLLLYVPGNHDDVGFQSLIP